MDPTRDDVECRLRTFLGMPFALEMGPHGWECPAWTRSALRALDVPDELVPDGHTEFERVHAAVGHEIAMRSNGFPPEWRRLDPLPFGPPDDGTVLCLVGFWSRHPTFAAHIVAAGSVWHPWPPDGVVRTAWSVIRPWVKEAWSL